MPNRTWEQAGRIDAAGHKLTEALHSYAHGTHSYSSEIETALRTTGQSDIADDLAKLRHAWTQASNDYAEALRR